jgi:hypothetical protein
MVSDAKKAVRMAGLVLPERIRAEHIYDTTRLRAFLEPFSGRPLHFQR